MDRFTGGCLLLLGALLSDCASAQTVSLAARPERVPLEMATAFPGHTEAGPCCDALAQAVARGCWPRYFVVIFAFESDSKRPKYAHSFGTFIKLGPPRPGSDRPTMECQTISWLPREYGDDYKLGFGRRIGHNYTLGESLSFAYDRCLNVCAFGPYEIDCELYREVTEHIAFLNSGRVRYKVVALFQRVPAYLHIRGGAMNCINALAQPAGYLASGAKYGCRLSAFMVDHYSDHIIGCRCHPWVYELLRENICCDVGRSSGCGCGGDHCCHVKLPPCPHCEPPEHCKPRFSISTFQATIVSGNR